MTTKDGLTIKQTKFVKGVVEGKSGLQAALDAYDTDDQMVAGQIAYENMRKPVIREQVEQALKVQGLELSSILKNLGDLATRDVQNVSADAKIKANVELLKLIGAYPKDKSGSSVQINVGDKVINLTYGEAKKELEDLNSVIGEIVNDVESTPTE